MLGLTHWTTHTSLISSKLRKPRVGEKRIDEIVTHQEKKKMHTANSSLYSTNLIFLGGFPNYF